ncbi:uncharacterized protein [Misgurnus anguillicaudatus]|uniref:uncharacterized protein n=1 Tax=Misgurnus anguillicaudatus TaxID=75329 RepID=UPI003CCF1E4D
MRYHALTHPTASESSCLPYVPKISKAKRSKVWLYYTKKYSETATCNKCLSKTACKRGNTSNLMKHLRTHGINLKAEECTVFDCLQTSADSLEVPGPSQPHPSNVGTIDCDNDDSSLSAASTSSMVVTPFTLAKKAILPKEKVEEFHRAVTKFVVKGLHSFSTVESPWFREMVTALNPRYRPPSRDELSNTLIPAWYNVEKQNVIQELAQVSKGRFIVVRRSYAVATA